MTRAAFARKLASTLLLAALLGGCNMPGFEPHVEPLEIATLPPQPDFEEPELPPEVEQLPQQPPPEPPELEPIEPEFTPFCTLDGLNIRSSPAVQDDNLVGLLPAGTDVSWEGEEHIDAERTWYFVEAETGQSGWVASDWLRPGDCNQAVSGGETPTIIDGATDDYGFTWLDPDADTTHYGVDITSTAGDNSIYAPYSGRVVAQDACDACVDEDHPDGKHKGEYDAEYNFGYGAMTVVEFPYSQLSEADRAALAEDGIELTEGQSLYMMVGHLDPNETMLEAGTELGPQDVIASIGTSGNSSGPHAHVEAAVNDSGLTPGEGESTFTFWTSSVVERPSVGEQGLRFDPTPLFDLAD